MTTLVGSTIDAQQALAPPAPSGLTDWLIALLQQIVTLNFALVLVALAVGLLVAVGATEFSKRFASLFAGPHWDLKAQLYSALWGAVTTSLLILALTDWPLKGRVVAIIVVAPLAAFYSHRAYDVLRRLFPHLMAKASRKLRGDQNNDESPP